ncbi:MAG: hypothetical protein ACE5HW_04335 [Candidatus Methanofastidiosia archaeon]
MEEDVIIKSNVPRVLTLPLAKLIFRKEKRISSRLFSHTLTNFIDSLGEEKAKTTLYYVGRKVAKDLSREMEKEYNTKRVKSWEELLGNIEIFSEILNGCKSRMVKAKKSHTLLRLYDCPYCLLKKEYTSPICSLASGVLAGVPEFALPDVSSSCVETKCNAVDSFLGFCEFKLSIKYIK